MPRFSLRRVVVALAVLLLVAAAPGLRSQTQEPRFRGGANLVRLDVYASKDGVAVTDLTAADFEVLEDNAPQQVTSFELIKTRGVVPTSARIEPNTVAESRERAAQPDARLFVLFLDTLHVQVEGSYHAQNPVSALLDRVVGEDDLVGVMTPEITARNIAFSPRTSSVGRMLEANWNWGERGAANTRDPRDREIENCYPDAGPTIGMAKSILERRREQRVLDAIEDLVQHLEGLREERSFVLMLTEGWLMPAPDPALARPIDWPGGQRTVPGGPDSIGVIDGKLATRAGGTDRGLESCERERGLLANQDFAMAFQQLMRRANRANVSFYPIDPRGLVVFDDPIGPGRPATQYVDSQRLASRQSHLRQLAEETDGAVVLNTNIDKALPRLLNDVGSYYLLGYVSTNQKLDGRYRKLTVRVKRPGVELRARPGYLAPTAAEVSAAQTPPPKTKGAAPSVGQALSHLPAGRRPSPIYVQATGGTGYVQLTLEVDRATAALPEWAKGAQVRVDIEPADGSGAAARHSETVSLAPGARVYSLRRPDGAALPPGSYQVRVQATPEGSRAPVTASAVVAVPKAASLLGSAALASRRTGRVVTATADPRFRRTERLLLETPIVGASPVITGRLLNREGQVMAVPVTVTERVDDPSHARLSVADVALAPLAPGDYVVEVVATDGANTETVSYAVRIVP